MSSRAVIIGRSFGSSARSSSVPTPDATRREEQVVDLVISDLVQSGRSVTLLDRPDRHPDRADGLTVDAELSVDGQRSAMDVTTLRWRSGLEGAVEKLEARLEREFGADLDAAGRTLVMTGHVSADEDVIRSLVELARRAVTSGQNQERNDEAASLWPRARNWAQSSCSHGSASRRTGRTRSSSRRDSRSGRSYEDSYPAREPLVTLGYRTRLAIDQRGPPT